MQFLNHAQRYIDLLLAEYQGNREQAETVFIAGMGQIFHDYCDLLGNGTPAERAKFILQAGLRKQLEDAILNQTKTEDQKPI